jgi:hypothetical protein
MYKKLILASAIAAVSGQAAAASWVTSNFGTQVAVKHTAEGIDKVTEADGVATSGAVLSLGAAFAQNDTITFTYNTAKATNYNWPTNLYSRKPGAFAAASRIGATGIASGNVTTSLIESGNANTLDSSQLAVGDICNFDGTTVDHRITANNTTNDTITFTPKLAADVAVGDTVVCDNPTWIKLGLINSTDSSVTYRVTSATGGSSSVGTEISVPTPDVSVAALKGTKAVTVAYSAATASGVAMDATAATGAMGTVIDEIKYAVTTKFNGVIDVENDKKVYASNFVTNNTNADSVVITATLTSGTEGDKHTIADSGAVTLDAAVNDVMTSAQGAVTTITGDFAYLDDAVTAGVQNTSSGLTLTNADSVALATTGASFAITDTTVASEAITVVVDNSEDVALAAQSFTGSTLVTYTSNSIATATKTVDHGSLGSWTLNGASVTAYAVPMGSSVSRFLWVTNGGATSAAVDYTITMNGSSYGPYSIGSVAAKTSTSVAGLIDTDLTARGIYVAPNSRANINVSAPVKANDITMSASYKHIGDADRLGLETSDTLTAADGK